jgi:uncharacterized protein YkwD
MGRLLAVVALFVPLTTSGVACRVVPNPRVTGSDGSVTRGSTARENEIAADLIARANAERGARGLKALVWDPKLATRAFGWSETMAGTGLRHSDLHPLLARFVGVAENIGTGAPSTTAGAMHLAWMHSDSHRHDLLAPNLDRVGIGVVCGADGTIWATQQFGSTGSGEFGAVAPTNPIARPDPGSLTC